MTQQQMNEYNFPVELQPIYFGERSEISDKKAVVRTDTQQALGVVSNSYGLVTHSSVINSFAKALKKYDTQETVKLTHNGTHLFYQVLFPKVTMEVTQGDIVQMMMTVKNSYNGHGSLQVILQALRLVCLNGMVVGEQFLHFSFRHYANIEQFADQQAVGASIKRFHQSAPMIQAMSTTKIEPQHHFTRKDVLLPDYLLTSAKEEWEKQASPSVWSYYNALTYAITHKQKQEAVSPKLMIAQGAKAWSAAARFL